MSEYVNIKAIIEVMNANGVEYVFFNPGIDTVPVLETLAKLRASGQPAPRGILCLDEFVTMTAAQGNYMVTGRPQVVSVHSELGTLQVGGALHNAQWGRVPAIMFAEIQGPPQRVNWRQESFDQGLMVRNFVKWDHQLGADEDIDNVLQEAFRIATTEPCGPVYLSLPREVLWSWKESSATRPVSAALPEVLPPADPGLLDKTAEIMLNANNPLIITGYTGRNPKAVPLLAELAETLSARVLAANMRMNFPSTHPLAAYLEPGGSFGSPLLTDADALLVIDYDMPYAAPPTVPKQDAKIIHIDIDTEKKGVPLWGRRPDILIKADSAETIPALNRIINKKLTPEKRREFQARFKRLGAEQQGIRDKWQALAMEQASRRPISAHWLCRCIDEAISEDDIIVNQAISPSAIVAHQIRRTKPGTLLSCPGGCIGWALGAALGVKLAAPERTVISLMGDGAFIYGCPEASLWAATFYNAPYLAIILNNQGYAAIKGLFRESYDVDNMGADISTPPDYAMIAQACNAYGRTVADPAEVKPAIIEALEQVKGGRPAVLDVRLEPV